MSASDLHSGGTLSLLCVAVVLADTGVYEAGQTKEEVAEA